MPTWTEQDDAILRQKWSQGLSATQIMLLLPGRSRNAIIGRVHRIGLPRRWNRPNPRKGQSRSEYNREVHRIRAEAAEKAALAAEIKNSRDRVKKLRALASLVSTEVSSSPPKVPAAPAPAFEGGAEPSCVRRPQ